MPNKGLQELGNFVPSARGFEPMPPAFPADRRTQDLESPEAQSVFSSDFSAGEDVLGAKKLFAPLVELIIHGSAETPVTIGILGPAGSGKSFALKELARSIEALPQTGLAKSSGLNVLVVPIEANELAANPRSGLAHALYQALSEKFPQAAQTAAQAARDPHQVAKDAAEKYEAICQKLKLERHNLEEAETQRAKLTDTILYSSAGSAIDAYARTLKSKLEARFKRFGIGGEPIVNFKNLIFYLAEKPGFSGRTSLALRALVGFKSQIRLIAATVILIILGYGIQWASDHPDSWLPSLRGNETTLPLAHWFQIHMDWIAATGSILVYLAALTAVLVIWRAIRFLQPVLRGQSIFANELAERRRELNASLANQTQRVEMLSRDAGVLAQTLSDAERRIGGRVYPAAPFLAPYPSREARNFLKELSGLMLQKKFIPKMPERIVFALDHLENLNSADKSAVLSGLQNPLPAGFVLILALNPAGLEADQKNSIEKLIQVPFQIGKRLARDLTPLFQTLAGTGTEATTGGETAPLQPLEDPLSENEKSLLAQFVDLAGRSPRSLKRFVNLYRLCRMIETHRGALALWLALDAGGTDEEIELMEHALQNRAEADFAQKSPRLAFALAAADRFEPKLTIEALQHAALIAGRFSFRL